MNRLIIDRFEGEWAIIEYEAGKTFSVPTMLLPKEVKEGDVLTLQFTIDKEETRQQRKRIRGLLDELRSEDKGGDIEL